MKRIIVLLATLLLTLSMIGPAWGNGPADRQASDVVSFVTDEVVGDARLVRTDTGVGYSLRTSDLEKGHAISIWWVIFNAPENCDLEPEDKDHCGIDDLFTNYPFGEGVVPDVNDTVEPAVMSGGGHAIGASGKAGFAGHLNEGQITVEHPLFTDGPGLTDARGAEIHLVVRSHGPVQPGLNHEMFNSFEAGCEVFLPAGMVPEEEGQCADQHFAVFK